MPQEIANGGKKLQQKWILQQTHPSIAGGSATQMNATELRYLNRMTGAGTQASVDLVNIVDKPIEGQSTGFFGRRGAPTGIISAGFDTLANKITSQEAQEYEAMATGFKRALGFIESAGLAPPGSLIDQMDQIIFHAGNTNFVKLRKLAQTRQIVEAGLEQYVNDPRVPEGMRKQIGVIDDRIKKAVPFTQLDLNELQRQGFDNRKITLKDIIEANKNRAPAGLSAEKEARYQELKAKERAGELQ